MENTVEVTQFLATSLARFMATNQLNHQRWTKSRVADFITSKDEISGSISDNTIGRFLDPGHPQAASKSTIRKVKEFLLHFEYISSAQLELYQYPKEVRAASAISDFFTPEPLKRQLELYEKLDGHYANYVARPPYVLENRLFITNHKEEKILTCFETLTLYKIANTQLLHSMTSNFQRSDFNRATPLVKSAGGQEVARHVMSGAVIANDGLISFVTKALTSGFSSICNVDSINMDDDDNICTLNGVRNRGWTILDIGEKVALFQDVPSCSPYAALKHLSGEAKYYPQFVESTQSRKIAVSEENLDDQNLRKFAPDKDAIENQLFQKQLGMDDGRKQIDLAETKDDKLKLSIEWGNLDCFTEALDEGADPNLILEDSGLPVVFFLSNAGRTEWIKALVNTGKCDLTVVDKKGMPPSYYAGLVARQMGAQTVPVDEAQQYSDLTKYLQDEELKQIASNPPGVNPPEL